MPLFPILVAALKLYDEGKPERDAAFQRALDYGDVSLCHASMAHEEHELRMLRDAFFKEEFNPNTRDKLDCVGVEYFRRMALLAPLDVAEVFTL